MSEITFYAKKKLNNYMTLVLETHVPPDHLDCIEMRIYIDKQKYYNNNPESIGEMLDYIRTAILNLDEWCYKEYYYTADDISDILKLDLVQQALIKLLKGDIKTTNLEEWEW